jgi:hypothetical protein
MAGIGCDASGIGAAWQAPAADRNRASHYATPGARLPRRRGSGHGAGRRAGALAFAPTAEGPIRCAGRFEEGTAASSGTSGGTDVGIAENKRAAAQLIVALASVDKQAFDAVTRPDTRWWTAGMPGTYTRDEYFQFSKDASLLLKQPNFNMKMVGITAEGDRVAIEGETHTELQDGRVYQNKYHFLLIFEEGRVKEVREYHDTQHALQTFQPG